MIDRCPTHPRFPFDSCPICERRIEREEAARDDPGDEHDVEREEIRYERWLDEIGGSR